MIYDAVHQAVLLYQGHEAKLLELAAPLTLPPPSAREQELQALWKQFYDTLEIKARHSEKGRMSHCPKRFGRIWWKCGDSLQKGCICAVALCKRYGILKGSFGRASAAPTPKRAMIKGAL